MRGRARWSSLAVGVLYVLLSACGGDGSGATPPPSSGNPNTPPDDPNNPEQSLGSFTVSSESLNFVFMEDDEWAPLPSRTIMLNVTGRARSDVYFQLSVDGDAIEAYLTLDGSVGVSPVQPYQLDPGLHYTFPTTRAEITSEGNCASADL